MKTEHTWARLLAYVTGLVNQELLLQNEYFAAENRIVRAQLPSRLRLANPERATVAEIGKRVGRKALAQVACVAKSDNPGLVSPTGCAEVRRLQAPVVVLKRSPSYFDLLARTQRGATTVSREHWPTSDTRCRTRPWAMFSVDTALRRHPDVVRPRLGKTSSGRTWPCSPEVTSSR
jgi:hypothetical protein